MEDSLETIRKAIKEQLLRAGYFGAAKCSHLIRKDIAISSVEIPNYSLTYDDPYFPGMTYVFAIAGADTNDGWRICSIKTMFALYEHRLELTQFRVEKNYDTTGNFLPSPKRLQEEMIELIRIEEARKVLKLYPAIEEQLTDLGFDTSRFQTDFGKTDRQATGLICIEDIELDTYTVMGCLGFYFKLAFPFAQPCTVDRIIVYLGADVDEGGDSDFRLITTKEFQSSSAPLPEWHVIVDEFLLIFENFCRQLNGPKRTTAEGKAHFSCEDQSDKSSRARASPQ